MSGATFRFGDDEYISVDGPDDTGALEQVEAAGDHPFLVVEIDDDVWRSVGFVDLDDWDDWESFFDWLEEWVGDHYAG